MRSNTLFTQTQRKSSIQISRHKKLWRYFGTHSFFWKEAVLLYQPYHITISTVQQNFSSTILSDLILSMIVIRHYWKPEKLGRRCIKCFSQCHYNNVIITSLTIVYSTVSNHQAHDSLLNHLFRRISKKASKLRVTGLLRGIHRSPVNSPHKGPVTRKMFPIDDVIMTVSADGLSPLGTEGLTYWGLN